MIILDLTHLRELKTPSASMSTRAAAATCRARQRIAAIAAGHFATPKDRRAKDKLLQAASGLSMRREQQAGLSRTFGPFVDSSHVFPQQNMQLVCDSVPTAGFS